MPTEAIWNSLRAGRPLGVKRYNKLLASQVAALAWSDSGEGWLNFGYASLAARLRAGKDFDADGAPIARKAIRNGLRRKPLAPESWYWLAVIRSGTPTMRRRTVDALQMSLYTGPHLRSIAILRLRLILRLWATYKADERQMVYRQIRFAWAASRGGVVDIAYKSQNPWPIRIALALSPKQLRTFEWMLRQRARNSKK